MHCFKETQPAPWAIRIGFWVCLGLYVLSFWLPISFDQKQERGYALFFYGIWGMMIAVWAPILAMIHGATPNGWSEVLQFCVAVGPWLANPVLWFALAHFGMGNGSAALRTSLWAAGLAASYALLAGLSGSPGRPWTVRLPPSPAYLVWLGSMVVLALFSAALAFHQRRFRIPVCAADMEYWAHPGEYASALPHPGRTEDHVKSAQ